MDCAGIEHELKSQINLSSLLFVPGGGFEASGVTCGLQHKKSRSCALTDLRVSVAVHPIASNGSEKKWLAN